MSEVEDRVQRKLLEFYKSRFASWDNISLSNVDRISDGWENDVYSFRLGYEDDGEQREQELILRIYPGDSAPQKSRREFDGMRKLYDIGFPVPEVMILESDGSVLGKPFVIMEKINGRSMEDVFIESPEEKRQELIALFCKMFFHLHSLDWRPFAPEPSIYEIGDPRIFIEQWLLRFQSRIENFRAYEFLPVLNWLRENSSDVLCEQPSVVHMDYHTFNILLTDDGKASVHHLGEEGLKPVEIIGNSDFRKVLYFNPQSSDGKSRSEMIHDLVEQIEIVTKKGNQEELQALHNRLVDMGYEHVSLAIKTEQAVPSHRAARVRPWLRHPHARQSVQSRACRQAARRALFHHQRTCAALK